MRLEPENGLASTYELLSLSERPSFVRTRVFRTLYLLNLNLPKPVLRAYVLIRVAFVAIAVRRRVASLELAGPFGGGQRSWSLPGLLLEHDLHLYHVRSHTLLLVVTTALSRRRAGSSHGGRR